MRPASDGRGRRSARPTPRSSSTTAPRGGSRSPIRTAPRTFSTGEIVYGAKAPDVYAQIDSYDDALAVIRRLKAARSEREVEGIFNLRARVEAALGRVPLRVHQDIVLTSQMFVEGDDVILLPAATRYEQEGGGTSTTTETSAVLTISTSSLIF